MKGGPGDFDVCHYGYDFCSCDCEQCKESVKEEDLDILRQKVQEMRQYNPELLQFILDNHESIAQEWKTIHDTNSNS